MKDRRVLFAGTPAFALASLTALVDAGITPIAVLTQPDRAAGRGRRLTASPVKRYAVRHGIAVLQPRTLDDAAVGAELEALEPDILIVAAYGLILPQDILDIPSGGCVNVHASLLPRWRGAAPIQAAILSGDAETGVSLMAMTAGLDCGPVYVTEAVSIGDRETAGELHDRLAELGGRLLVRHLDDILEGRLTAVPQDERGATYASKVETADAAIDWRRPADALQRQVQAFNPVPGAYFSWRDMRIKCWRAHAVAGTNCPPGTVLGCDGIAVACGDGALRLESLQRPGKRPVTAREFAASFDLSGQRFG